MKRILIINVNWLGDVLFSTPMIRALREKFPDAHIACLVVPRCKEVLESNPRLNEVIIYEEQEGHKGIFGKLKLIAELKKRKFDAAILVHRSFTRALIAFLAGIPRRIGYRTKNRSFLLSDAVSLPEEELHRVDYFLNLARAVGADGGGREYEFFVSDRDRAGALRFLEENGVKATEFLAVLNPGGNWDPKRWAKENFAQLADALTKRFGAKIVITGAKKDIPLAQAISKMAGGRPIIACGKTTLKELAAIFERANIVIANDSGPMHISVAVGAKTVALFGPTDPRITGPVGKGRYAVLHKNENCEVPCYNLGCTEYRCMKEIKVEDVLNAAEAII